MTFRVHASNRHADTPILVGSSAAIQLVREQIATMAPFPWPVRIEGERGTGKNVAARLLHDASGCSGAFVQCGLNVVSASEGRELAELSGWARGAFTGAIHAYAGAAEQAHLGTLFLNEIGLASSRVQQILLGLFDQKAIRRMGEALWRPVKVRVVFATNANLEAAVKAKTFRDDLYDRLGRHVITMPPLRTRLEDVPELAATLLVRKAAEAGVSAPVLRLSEMDRLMSHRWPGNVRDLEDALEHYIMWRRLPTWVPGARRRSTGWPSLVAAALEQCRGDKTAAADALGISRKTLYAHLRRYHA